MPHTIGAQLGIRGTADCTTLGSLGEDLRIGL